jgi:hypothetical protein
MLYELHKLFRVEWYDRMINSVTFKESGWDTVTICFKDLPGIRKKGLGETTTSLSRANRSQGQPLEQISEVLHADKIKTKDIHGEFRYGNFVK